MRDMFEYKGYKLRVAEEGGCKVYIYPPGEDLPMRRVPRARNASKEAVMDSAKAYVDGVIVRRAVRAERLRHATMQRDTGEALLRCLQRT